MRVSVDVDRCDSTGLCCRIAPDVFDLDDDDVLRVLTQYPAAGQRAAVEEAARSCPKLAISVEEMP